MVGSYLLEHGQIISDHTIDENDTHTNMQPLAANRSQEGVGI